MAQKYFGSNIPVASGFDLSAQKPLDARTVVATYADLATIPAIQKYKGLTVYVEDQNKKYRWNNTTWELEEMKGEKGDTGATGAKGAEGTAATIAVGTVTTGGAGSTATITNAGTANAARFNFAIPKGDKGDTGATGSQGIQGVPGVKGDTGLQGAQGIQGAKGDKGDTGPKGNTGDTGEGFNIFKTYASVAAMNADKANVANGKFVLIASSVSDVDNAKLYVRDASGFSFLTDLSGAQGIKGETGSQGIQGLKGDKGDTGAQGIQGAQGVKGETGAQGAQGIAGVKGDKGDTGAQGIQGTKGADGTVWYTGFTISGDLGSPGSVVPGSGIAYANLNDLYLNIETSDVYFCNLPGTPTVAKWKYKTCLKGIKGDTGAKGAQGDKGLTGETGAQGIQGVEGTSYNVDANKGFFHRNELTIDSSILFKGSSFTNERQSFIKDGYWLVYAKVDGEDIVLVDNEKNINGTCEVYIGEYFDKNITGIQCVLMRTPGVCIYGVKNIPIFDDRKGDKGDTGETVRIGTSYPTAAQARLFFKILP